MATPKKTSGKQVRRPKRLPDPPRPIERTEVYKIRGDDGVTRTIRRNMDTGKSEIIG